MDFVLDFILNKIGYEKKYLDYRERVGLAGLCRLPNLSGEIRMNMVVLRRPVIRGVNSAGTVSAFLKTVCGWTTRLCNPL